MQDILYSVERVGSPPSPVARQDLTDMMIAVRELSRASQAIVVERDNYGNPLSVVAQSSPHDPCLELDAVRELILPQPGAARWIAGKVPDTRTTLLVGLPPLALGGSRLALLLTFVDPTAASRESVERNVPAISTLLASYLVLDERFERAQRQRRAAFAALQQSECGIVVVRADRTVLLRNAAADAILAAEDAVTLRDEVLRLTNYSDAIRFYTAIDCVVEAPVAKARDRRSGIVMLVARRKGSRPLIAVITPATYADAGEAAAIIYLLNPDQTVVRGIGPICAAHGLSQVETRLVTHLVGGATISEAANEMCIKPSTARSYLKQIFVKTNSHRQVDLVQLFARYLRAVRGNYDFQAG